MRQLTWAKSDSRLRFMITYRVEETALKKTVRVTTTTIITPQNPVEFLAAARVKDAEAKTENCEDRTSILYAQMVTPEQVDAFGFNEEGEYEGVAEDV